ncbi:hypothetical protein NMD85_08830 [Edwardsiella tarda]
MRIRDGAWFWPYGPQPLHGAINLTLEEWRQGWRHATLQARLNMLSQGEQGKANLVMQLGPGRLDLQPGLSLCAWMGESISRHCLSPPRSRPR